MKFTRFDVYLCLVALIAAVAIGVAYLDSGQREILKQVQEMRASAIRPAPQPAKPATPPPPPAMPAEVSIDNSASRGRADARVVMVEFSDFECSFCGRYTRETLPRIEKEYIATGKIRQVFRNFPLPPSMHPNALKAGEAGECARLQGKFWEMHDVLYANQQALTAPLLPNHAKAVGLDMTKFTACMNGQALPKIKADQDAGARAGVGGTPYFLFGVPEPGGKIRVLDYIYQGAVPYENFKTILDKLLAQA
jgi:protein-disulfide isomerase